MGISTAHTASANRERIDVHFHQVSGGAGSWLAARVDMAANPDVEHRFVFADTLYEDADCYRFLIEGVANLVGRSVSIPDLDQFPDYRVPDDTPIEEYAGNPDWRAFLAEIRTRAADELPELTWLVEGRDPWEVFRDKRFLGNSRADPCSYELKRQTINAWRDLNADPARDVFIVGIGPHEAQRFEGRTGKVKTPGLRKRMADAGWTYAAPLIGSFEGEVGPFGYLHDQGIRRPRLYEYYVHNNCGGMCIKAGHGHYITRLQRQPERFAYDAMMERKLAAYLGKPVTMMTWRAGGDKTVYSLDDMRRKWESEGPYMDPYADATEGDSGCGCMIDEGTA